MSLRWRLTLGLGLIATLMVLGGATAAYLTTANRLHDTLDESLRTASARLPGVRHGDQPEPPPRDDGRDGFDRPEGCPPGGDLAPAVAAQRIDADSTVATCIEGAPEIPVDRSDRALATDGGATRLRTVTIDDVDYRVVTVAASGSAFQLARPLTETDGVLGSLRLRLALVGTAGVLAAMGLGWLFARRITQPITRLQRAAEHIAASQDLDSEVPVGGPAEVGSLARSFTTMVRALAASRRAQRELVRDASHELRTPLTSLRTNSELLERAAELTPEEYARVVGAIRDETQELAHLVAELVDLATDAPLELHDAPVELGSIAESVAATARRRTGRVIQVDVAPDHDDVVLADRQLLERALSNIVDNAVKYSPDGTDIDISVAGTRVEVRDRGQGIDAADVDRVFDRFYRAPRAQSMPGSGLGLAIVAQAIGHYDGSVFAQRRDGGGAVVGFELVAPDDALRGSDTAPQEL